MNRSLNALARTMVLSAVVCIGGAAHAGLITFNDPAVIEINNDTGVATYAEAGFVITGLATSFLTIDEALVGGFDATPFTLSVLGGGSFVLQSLDIEAFDLGFGPGTLIVAGLFDGVEVASRSFDLATETGSVSFDSAWANLSSVRFSATGGFALDNINAVPEPTSILLAGAGLLLATGRRRR